MIHAATAKQGRKYKFGDKEVISMGPGVVVRVRPIDHSEPYPLGEDITVKASWLQPLAMKYHGGEIPL